jgi:hypothetical protein
MRDELWLPSLSWWTIAREEKLEAKLKKGIRQRGFRHNAGFEGSRDSLLVLEGMRLNRTIGQ